MSEQGHRGTFVDKELFRVIHQRGRTGMSAWIPSFLFKLPFETKRVREHRAAEQVVREKHRL